MEDRNAGNDCVLAELKPEPIPEAVPRAEVELKIEGDGPSTGELDEPKRDGQLFGPDTGPGPDAVKIEQGGDDVVLKVFANDDVLKSNELNPRTDEATEPEELGAGVLGANEL